MRAGFKNPESQKRFFATCRPAGTSWREFHALVSAECGFEFTFRAFKHWYRAERLPPLEVVETVGGLGDSQALFEVLDDGWGQRKGGNVRAVKHGNTLSIEDRRRGGSHSCELLKHRLGNGFGEYWKSFSSKGGARSLELKTSLLRKAVGPKGEKMFNALEVAVAACLYSKGITYAYEPKLTAGERARFPDFVAGRRIIECTSWANAHAKSASLISRFTWFHKAIPGLMPLVITTQRLKHVYVDYLQGVAEAVSLGEFQENTPGILIGS